MATKFITASDSSVVLDGEATFCHIRDKFHLRGAYFGPGIHHRYHWRGSKRAVTGPDRSSYFGLDTNTITNVLCKADTNAPAVVSDNYSGAGNVAGDDTMLLGSETVGDSDVLSGAIVAPPSTDRKALPETGGQALAQILYALGGVMITGGGIMLKRKGK